MSGGANFFPQSQVFDELFHFQRGASQFFASLMIARFMVIFMRFRTQGDLNLEFIWGQKGLPFRSFEIYFEQLGFIYVWVNFQLTAYLIFSFVSDFVQNIINYSLLLLKVEDFYTSVKRDFSVKKFISYSKNFFDLLSLHRDVIIQYNDGII